MHLMLPFLSVLLLLTACSPSLAPKNEFSQYGFMDGIYSTRPQASHPVITILKLKTPALLESAHRDKGVLVINKKTLAAIEAEQAATIEALQKISPDIRVLIRYRLVLNGLTIYAPQDVLEQIEGLPNVISAEMSATFDRPRPMSEEAKPATVGKNTSVKFIGTEAAYAENLRGQGMRVGIIDTGVDYTHKMFLGEGTPEAYKNNDPSLANANFPNKKVVGGIDIVGSKFNPAAADFNMRIPRPDANPLDEAGHGTHVAGTVAGIGDGINTYTGVAPEASLYAIKVFGANGSTSLEAVIAALEYAADPTADLSFKEQLDVVNLSIGSGYGSAHSLYNLAIKNLTSIGTVVVGSAGNFGDKPYITGSPGASDQAISVASSLDNQNQNIQFPTMEFTADGVAELTEIIEATISKPLAEIPAVRGQVIYAGLADADYDQNQKNLLKDKIALIDRGVVDFSVKIQRAQEAGAMAVIVGNNADGAILIMGGNGKFNIPAVMISKEATDKIKLRLAKGPVHANLKTTQPITKEWLIDTISSFSSRGPRSEDGFIKPEIVSPGSNIISAGMGGGDKGRLMSGTSMASPHVAGVITLLKQKFKELSTQELKSVLMSQGKPLFDEKKIIYPIARQGAGRVQVAASLKAKVVTMPSSLSFGIVDVEKTQTLSQQITVKNISSETLTLNPKWNGSPALQIYASTLSLAPDETKTFNIRVKIMSSQMKKPSEEIDGFLKLSSDHEVLVQLPLLVIARKISAISAKSLTVQNNEATLVLRNNGDNPGQVFLFNSLGVDGRKKSPKINSLANPNCDLQSAGYRIIEKDGRQVLQIAVKLFQQVTSWHHCHVNVQIDSNSDNIADQEIAGEVQSNLTGLTGDGFISLLLDSNKAREIRKNFETNITTDPKNAKEDYTSALMDRRPMMLFENSTLAIIEADLARLVRNPQGDIQIKVSTTHPAEMAIESDDYLANQNTQWRKLSLDASAQSFNQIPEEVKLEDLEVQTISFAKGSGIEPLVIYAPQNRSVQDPLREDSQSQIISPESSK